MAFNALGFVVANALTQDMIDRDRATQISLVGGLLGGSLTSVVLLSTIAGQQAPAPGTGAPATADLVEVPELEDDPEVAKGLLTVRGLVPEIVDVASDEPKDTVIGSEPIAGSFVAPGSTVNILVSIGVEVPDVTAKPYDHAEATLKSAGLESARRAADKDKTGPADTVEHQEPAAGDYVDAGSSVTLFVFPSKKTTALRSAGRSKPDNE